MGEPQPAAQPDEPCFLGVASSLSGKRWIARPSDERESMALAQRLGVPEIIGRVLSARGVGLQEADDFLSPTLKRLLPDPSVLKDMDVAADRLAGAVMSREQIAIFGDYDVDGATSAALLSRLLAAVGGRCRIYIPDRAREGYGPNQAALLGLKDEGVSLVVTVDCGIAAHAPLAAAADAGLDVIVVDHHAAEAELPRAAAVINPNRLDESGELGQLAAVGVSFLLAVAVNRALRRAGWYQDRPEPDLRQWLDLVALGTVCDVVPLRGVNRALVAQGLKVMAARANPGLRALADAASLAEAPGAYHLGFILGPRINAGGRVGTSDLGARLLSTEDEAEARDIALRLEELNTERREIESAVLERAMDQVERSDHQGPLILAAGEGWHGGVIGIVASRLKERFHRPAFVVSIDGETATGSGRSVGGVDLGQAVIAARQAGLLIKGGGHPMAAGFTAESRRLDDVHAFLEERIAASLGPGALVPLLSMDGALKVAGASLDLVQTLDRMSPFGAGNPEPRFAVAGARIDYAKVVGKEQNHLRLTLLDDGGGRLGAIAFRAMGSELGRALMHHDGAPFHVAGHVRANTWQGRTTAQMIVEDAAPA
ncbi:MAG: single-stranded-DNA-specific exonuclease RecJ [Proteobacteria bacterium]|nr:single-stranded-DNA-specific exonuclease RecJ [Pseudomonadota bacterium]